MNMLEAGFQLNDLYQQLGKAIRQPNIPTALIVVDEMKGILRKLRAAVYPSMGTSFQAEVGKRRITCDVCGKEKGLTAFPKGSTTCRYCLAELEGNQ